MVVTQAPGNSNEPSRKVYGSVVKAGSGVLVPLLLSPFRPVVAVSWPPLPSAGGNSDGDSEIMPGVLFAPDVQVPIEHGIENALTNPAKSLSLGMHKSGPPTKGTIIGGGDVFLGQFGGMVAIGLEVLDGFGGDAGARIDVVDAGEHLDELRDWIQWEMRDRMGGDMSAPLKVPGAIARIARKLPRHGRRLRRHWRALALSGAAPVGLAELMGHTFTAPTTRPADSQPPSSDHLQALEQKVKAHGAQQDTTSRRRVTAPPGWVRVDDAAKVCSLVYSSFVQWCARRPDDSRKDADSQIRLVRVEALHRYWTRREHGT